MFNLMWKNQELGWKKEKILTLNRFFYFFLLIKKNSAKLLWKTYSFIDI